MMPPKSYSQKGCLVCRNRRKKCDETKPVCQTCRRLSLRCIWAEPGKINPNFLPAGKVLRAIDVTLRSQSEFSSLIPTQSDVMFHVCPRLAISSGYPPLRNSNEHQLLLYLSSVWSLTTSPKPKTVQPDYSPILALSLETLWVRESLVALAAFLTSFRDETYRKQARDRYHSAIGQAEERLRSSNYLDYWQEVLVAQYLLAWIELDFLETTTLLLPRCMTIGHLLDQVVKRTSTAVEKFRSGFHRTILEGYLYQISVVSLFYSRKNQLVAMSSAVDNRLNLNCSGIGENLFVLYDINITRILFELTTLGHAESSAPNYGDKVNDISVALDKVSQRTKMIMHDKPQEPIDDQFWCISAAAAEALYILLAKIRDRDILPGHNDIKAHVTTAIRMLTSCTVKPAWTGPMVWILAILLCAAETVSATKAIHSAIERFKPGMWGADLARLRRVVEVVTLKRKEAYDMAQQAADRVLKRKEHDTLALLLQDGGLLAIS